MYGEFERDLINELRQINRSLQQILCYQSMILHTLDEMDEVKNEAENDVEEKSDCSRTRL